MSEETLFATSQGPKLGPRQARVYAFLDQPRYADEVGAMIHSARERHGMDERCDWCATEGNEVLRGLRGRGLVRARRSPGHGMEWYRPDLEKSRRLEESSQSEEIPF